MIILITLWNETNDTFYKNTILFESILHIFLENVPKHITEYRMLTLSGSDNFLTHLFMAFHKFSHLQHDVLWTVRSHQTSLLFYPLQTGGTQKRKNEIKSKREKANELKQHNHLRFKTVKVGSPRQTKLSFKSVCTCSRFSSG